MKIENSAGTQGRRWAVRTTASDCFQDSLGAVDPGSHTPDGESFFAIVSSINDELLLYVKVSGLDTLSRRCQLGIFVPLGLDVNVAVVCLDSFIRMLHQRAGVSKLFAKVHTEAIALREILWNSNFAEEVRIVDYFDHGQDLLILSRYL